MMEARSWMLYGECPEASKALFARESNLPLKAFRIVKTKFGPRTHTRARENINSAEPWHGKSLNALPKVLRKFDYGIRGD